MANGDPLHSDGQFATPFAIIDDAHRVYHGHGICHVTNTNDLLGFPWIEHLPEFKLFAKKFMIQTVTNDDLESKRTTEVDKVIAKINKDVDASFIRTINALPVSHPEICTATTNDEKLQLIHQNLQTGSWPKKPSKHISQLCTLKSELSIQNGCIMFGERIVVPDSLQERVLQMLTKVTQEFVE